MIMVNVSVPSIGRQYHFSLDEQAPVSMLIAEISEVICQKESCFLEGDIDKLHLCSKNRKKILSPEESLARYGIVNGDSLMLV